MSQDRIRFKIYRDEGEEEEEVDEKCRPLRPFIPLRPLFKYVPKSYH